MNKKKQSQTQQTMSYKSYVATLAQEGEGAPVATVFNSNDANYIGNIVWTRNSVGEYAGTLNGAFTWLKTVVFIGKSNPSMMFSATGEADGNRVTVLTGYIDTDGGTNYIPRADTALDTCPIEIRVYP